MPDSFQPPKRTWTKKFLDAFHGAWLGIRGQSSFTVHFVAALLVIVAGIVLQVTRIEWCILALCITIVLSAEMFNSTLELLSKAIDAAENPHLRDGLNIGSAAVLVAAIGASVVGATIFLFRLGHRLNWW